MAKAFGASVQAVHDTLRDLANKDQQGFITASEFNRFAQIAQLNIFNGFFDDIKDTQRLSKAGFNPSRDKSRLKRIQEDLSFFSSHITLERNRLTLAFERPIDLSRIIGITTDGSILLNVSTRKPIEICYDEEKIERILINNLSAPTDDFPVALVSEDINVFPTSINRIQVRYYKIPEGRSSTTGARIPSSPSYSATGDLIDFELPEHYVSDLVYAIGKMIGLNLRDTDIVNYTGQEMQARKQAETY